MSEPLTRTATVAETGETAFSVRIAVSGHELIGDEPEDMGGGDIGPSPYDFLLAALGECTVMTIRWYARRQNWPLVSAQAVVTHQKHEGRDVFAKFVDITGPDLTEEQKTRLLDVAAKCPVHKTLSAGADITTAWKE